MTAQREYQSPGGLAIETHELTKRFGGRTAVRGVDLAVPEGVAFGFLGPNGAGKTTLIRMLLGLTAPSSGTMVLLGEPVPARRASALARVGAIVEEPRFHLHLTGRENLRFAAAARGPEAARRIGAALARVGLAERAGDRVKSYSLGMRQRLGVARCLLADPLLLILDEPSNGLDPAGIREFRIMIRELVEADGRTVFVSSHLLDEVERTCDAVAIVDRGRIVTQGTVEDLSAAQERLILEVDDIPHALKVLASAGMQCEHQPDRQDIRVALTDGLPSAGRVNGLLMEAGVLVSRLERRRPTLEEGFLALTAAPEEAA